MKFKKSLPQPGARRMRARHHHGSDTPTSPRAILHHTDPNAPNISGGSVSRTQFLLLTTNPPWIKKTLNSSNKEMINCRLQILNHYFF